MYELTLVNEELLPIVEGIIKSLNWADNQGASIAVLKRYGFTIEHEITMRYRYIKPLKLQIGDIVDCNYGEHLYEEVSGGHVACIICDYIETESLAFVVPIVKRKFERAKNVLNVETIFYNGYDAGNILIDRGRYLSPMRFNKIIGHVSDDSLKTLLKKLKFELSLSRREKEFVYVIRKELNTRYFGSREQCAKEFIEAVGIQDISDLMCKALISARTIYEKLGIRYITKSSIVNEVKKYTDDYSSKEIEKILYRIYDEWVYYNTYSLTEFFRIYAKTYGHKKL